MFANVHISAIIFIASLIPFVRGNLRHRKDSKKKNKPNLVERFDVWEEQGNRRRKGEAEKGDWQRDLGKFSRG